MVKFIVLFRQFRPSKEPDFNTFLIKLDALPDVLRKSVNEVYAAAGGPSPYRAIVEVFFKDRATMEAALQSEPGIEAGQFLQHFAGPDAIILYANVTEEDRPT